jgi:hypothetical protein
MAKRGVRNAAQSDIVKAKIRKTNLDRYGVEQTGACPVRRKKATETNLARYGTENVFASEDTKAKIRESVLASRGVDHVSKDPNHQRAMQEAVRLKFGVDNVAQVPEIKTKIVETNNVRYGGNTPASSIEVRRKMQQSMEERHGGHVSHLHISPEYRIRGIDDFRTRFENRRADEVAAETGYHPSIIHRYARMWDVSLDYTGGSKRESQNEFAERLRREGFCFEQNVRMLADADVTDRRSFKEIDFFFRKEGIGVEFCGVYWHSTACGREKDYHAEKRRLAANAGVRLLQVFQDEWIDHPEAVIAAIRHRLGMTQRRLGARQCDVVEIKHQDAMAFFSETHVQGGASSTLHLGLSERRTSSLVAVMSFTRRTSSRWEMTRYASRDLVMGGASKLLAAFEQREEWDEITSFVDLRWSDGDLYRTLGFAVDRTYGPDYSYVIGSRRVHKFSLRKSSKRFAKYKDSGMTERQMAEAEGIPRIYDAGKLRVIRRRPI